MSIIGMQRSLREIGRIRMGKSRPSNSGGKIPMRSETFILTSTDRNALEQAAKEYGGEVKPWEQPGKFVLETTVSELPLAVTRLVESQWYEAWSKGKCLTRCDGQTIQGPTGSEYVGKPCVCAMKFPDQDKRNMAASKGAACKVTTRIWFMLPNLPGLGTWRLESHGFYAASEMPMTLEFLRNALERGDQHLLNVILAIEPRESGQKKFLVPVIRMRQSVNEMLAISAPAASRQALAGPARTPMAAPAAPALTGGAVAALEHNPDDSEAWPEATG
jgi:hypothetical protein